MNIDFNNIISYILSIKFQENLFWLKIVFLAISSFFLIMIIFVLMRTQYLKLLMLQDIVEFFTFRPFGTRKMTKMWNKILMHLKAATESEYKLAVIEADDMLNSSLKRMGYAGQTLEERLEKLTSATFPNITEIYEAHKIRNNIVHDADYRLNLEEAKKTLDIYEKAFRNLQILA